MKKVLSSFTALLLVAVMLLSLTACGSERDKLVGDWTATVSLADIIESQINAQSEELGINMEIDSFDLKMLFSFKSDGTYSIAADKGSIDTAMDGLAESLKKSLRGYFEQEIEKQGLDMSVDELLELSNISLDSIVGQSLDALDTDEMVAAFESSGKFDAKDGKLFTYVGSIDEGVYETYELTDTELKITGSVGAGNSATEELTDIIYPLILTKTN